MVKFLTSFHRNLHPTSTSHQWKVRARKTDVLRAWNNYLYVQSRLQSSWWTIFNVFFGHLQWRCSQVY